MTKITVEKLVALGGKLWEKGDMKRVYFNYPELTKFYGLAYDGWKFTVDGERVSNNSGHQIGSALRNGKFWFNLATGEFASKGMSEKMTEKLIARIGEALVAAEDEVKTDETETTEPAETLTTETADVRTAVGPVVPAQQIRTNRKPGRCRNCGAIVPAGQGRLYYIDPDEAYEVSGWIVEHLDKGACQAEMNRRHEELAARARLYSAD